MSILFMPLMQKSRTVVFVNSSTPGNMPCMPHFDLHNLEADEEDVIAKSIHDRYAAQPDALDVITYAAFATTNNIQPGSVSNE